MSRIAVLAVLLLAPLSAQQGLTPQHVMRLGHVVQALPSPDGERIAYVVQQERPFGAEPGRPVATAFVMRSDGSGSVRLPESRGLAWRPDGAALTFVRADSGPPQVYQIPATGEGEPQPVTDVPHGVLAYEWRPDGGAIAYTTPDPLPELVLENRRRGFRPVVVDEEYRQISLWLFDVETRRTRRLTEGPTVMSFRWSPTGTHLCAGLAPRNLIDDRYMFTRLHIVEPESGRVARIVDNPGKLGQYAWSPDGERLAFIGAADRNDPHAGSLFVVDRAGTAVVPLTTNLRGMVRHVEWRDERALHVLWSRGVRTLFSTLPARPGLLDDAPARELPACDGFAVTGDGRVVIAASTGRFPAEVFTFDLAADGDAPQRLTTTNPWLADVELAEQRVETVLARDGLEIEGVLIAPLGFEEGRRYPFVIVAHGGPESHYLDGWLTRYSEPGQVLAAMGYAVWYPNYRSSTGYGVAFAKHDHGDPMGREFRDHLDAIDQFAGDGFVDPERVGVIGGSYGGYTAAWAATRHTERFAAAVSFVPFVDIRTKWLTSDIPWEFYYVHYEEQWPHEQVGFLADRSPLTWAKQCDTPLLLCGGTSDTRVHPSQPFMLYRAVRFATDTPVRYVQYPGEGHGNASNVYRYDYLLRSVRWLDHYLGAGDRRDAEPPPRELEYPEY